MSEVDLTPVVTLHERDGTPHTVYALQPKQYEAYRHTPLMIPEDWHYAPNIGYGGAAGGGKSYAARAIASAVALRWPGSTGIIFRRTEDEVVQNHVNKFKAEVPEELPDGSKVYSWNGERMCVTWANGSRTYFGYLRNFDDKDRYRGPEYDFMCFEESTLYGWPEVNWLKGNRLRATVDGARPFVFFPSNPGGKGHYWYKRLFIDRDFDPELDERPEDYVFIQAMLDDNQMLVQRDPEYIRRLNSMAEPFRSWMRDGKWDAGLGLALPMMDRDMHLVEPFEIPDHWVVWGAFDWGYAHPWVFGLYTKNEDGRTYKVFTLTGRMQQPPEIAATVNRKLYEYGLEPRHLRTIECGHDIWAEIKARGEETPTIEEQLRKWGWPCIQANISRVAGLNNLRDWLKWEEVHDDGSDGIPMLRFFDEPGNRECYKLLAGLPSDEDNPEDSAKLDADSMGKGGDDMYDETRYGMSRRVTPPRSRFLEDDFSAFSDGALRREAKENRKSRTPRSSRANNRNVLHPEFGRYV